MTRSADRPVTGSLFGLRAGPGWLDGVPVHYAVLDLGRLPVPSGRMLLTDPYGALGSGLVVDVPAGEHAVQLVRTRSDPVSLVVRCDGVGPAPGRPDVRLLGGVSVESGAVGVSDRTAAGRAAELIGPDGLVTALEADRHPVPECFSVPLPDTPGGRLIGSSVGGWGSGRFAVLAATDAEGGVVAVHLDLHAPWDGGSYRPADESAPTPQQREQLDRNLALIAAMTEAAEARARLQAAIEAAVAAGDPARATELLGQLHQLGAALAADPDLPGGSTPAP